MDVLMGVIILFFGVVAGTFGGKKIAKLRMKKQHKKLEKNAKKFMNGELENECEIDGRVRKVDKFVLRNDNQKDEVISFENGKMVKKLKDNPKKVQEEKRSVVKKIVKKSSKKSKK